MDENEEKAREIYKDLQKDYNGVEKVLMENENSFCIYADDDTLWKIFEDIENGVKSIEFNAGSNEPHYLRVTP